MKQAISSLAINHKIAFMKYFSLIIVCFSLFSCTSKFSKGKYVIDTIHPVITLDRYEKEFDLQDFIENISVFRI